jgi:N utilization substance protein A
MKSDFLLAVTQLAAERNLPREKILSAIEAALVSAYKKDNQGAGLNVSVRLNPATGDMKVFSLKEVVEEIEDPHSQMTLVEAREYNPLAEIGTTVEFETEPKLGRIGAQTAKQVVMQRLREAERELVFEEYAHREGEVVSATVQRLEKGDIILDLGRAEAVLPRTEQVLTERYRPNQRLKVYILEVRRSLKGPEVVVSRTHRDLVRRLFELEIPEIFNGIVEINAIAREPGSRSKMAVHARQDGVDPVGSCVGLRGIRIQNIVTELQGERIDVIPWHRDGAIFIGNSLSPATPVRVELREYDNIATVVVPDRQLSLAIGKEGQNARLAARLTGWKIEIRSATEFETERRGRIEPVKEVVAEEEAPPAEIAEVADAIAAAAAEVVAGEEPAMEPAASTEAAVAADGSLEAVAEPASPGSTKSAEEELLEEMLLEEGASQPREEEQVGQVDISGEDVWAVVPVAQESASGIRFAEDIMPEWGRRGGKGGKRRNRGRNQAEGPGRRGGSQDAGATPDGGA